jgi:hypothetical protein
VLIVCIAHLRRLASSTRLCPPSLPSLDIYTRSPTITSIFTRLFGSFAGPSPATMSAAKTKVQSIVNENGVGE